MVRAGRSCRLCVAGPLAGLAPPGPMLAVRAACGRPPARTSSMSLVAASASSRAAPTALLRRAAASTRLSRPTRGAPASLLLLLPGRLTRPASRQAPACAWGDHTAISTADTTPTEATSRAGRRVGRGARVAQRRGEWRRWVLGMFGLLARCQPGATGAGGQRAVTPSVDRPAGPGKAPMSGGLARLFAAERGRWCAGFSARGRLRGLSSAAAR